MPVSFAINPLPGRLGVEVQELDAAGKPVAKTNITVPGGHSLQRHIQPGHTFVISEQKPKP